MVDWCTDWFSTRYKFTHLSCNYAKSFVLIAKIKPAHFSNEVQGKFVDSLRQCVRVHRARSRADPCGGELKICHVVLFRVGSVKKKSNFMRLCVQKPIDTCMSSWSRHSAAMRDFTEPPETPKAWLNRRCLAKQIGVYVPILQYWISIKVLLVS